MLAEHLQQAAALEQLLIAPDAKPVPQAEVVTSVANCAEQLLLWGEADAALRLLQSAERIGEQISLEAAARLEYLTLRALWLLRRDHDCLRRARTFIARWNQKRVLGGHECDLVRIMEGQALWHMNRTTEALEQLRQIRLESLGRPAEASAVVCSLAISSSLLMMGAWVEGRELAIEGLVLARRIRSDYYIGLAHSYLCMAERGLCRWENSLEAGVAAISAYDKIDARLQSALVSRSLAITQWKRGRLQAASETIGETIPILTRTNQQAHLKYGSLLQGLVALHAGEIAKARARFSASDNQSSIISESRPELLRLEYLGDVELEQGHAAEALVRYDDVLPHALALIPRGDVVAELRRRRAECLGMLGRPQEAYDEAKEAIAICLELGDRYEEAATYRTLALAAAALGRADEAKKHFDHGFAYYDDIETPYEWGKLWMAYGDWLSGPHAGNYESLDGAREAYRAALDHFEQMGAELRLTHARQRMAALEQRMRDEGILAVDPGEKPRPRRRPSIDRELQRRVQWAHDTFGLVTRHRPLIEMLEQVAVVAASDIPVLVLGESGTGKELIARGVHALSGRTGGLVEVNCSAVPTTMMEAEFFGSLHGSFTGSTRDRAGLFEEAHEGSIFMDEIGEMPVDLQAKLLRFLETGEVRRIGATSGRRVDARLIAATNRDPVRMQAGDGFRQDLYYRLAHAVFTLPPIRVRGDDTALLVEHFLELFAQESRKRVVLSRAARERLVGYTWPGNVRQLRSLLQRLVVQTPEGHTITPRDIPLAEASDAPRSFNEEMVGQEKSRILDALEKTHYIKADAARILRMSRTTLLGKMKRYRIEG